MEKERWLSVKDSRLVDDGGNNVLLKGFGLGGWMNMENFITGFPANEETQRNAVRKALGQQKYQFFYDRFLEYFFEESDAKFIASLGLNLLRLPINYRHFEDDVRPFEIKYEGFKHLDRVVDLCSKHGIYTIIDLHALPGFQNQAWHSDNPTNKALLWQHKGFRDRVVNLWEVIADRYKSNPWVAGYNPVNEPGDADEDALMPFYERLYTAIRAVDPKHVLFLEGNRYSLDFHMFGEPWDNVVYTNHDYALPGFATGGPYPGETSDEYIDKHVLEKTFLRRSEYMLNHNTPIWVGEFGPVYPAWAPQTHQDRYQLLRDQLEIYQRYEANWAIWLYKDIGLQGVMCVDQQSPWLRRIQPILDKKARLGVDAWGGVDTEIADLMRPVEKRIAEEFPDYDPFPFGAEWQIKRLIRHILLAEPLAAEFGRLFIDMSETDIDQLMQSFRFEHCTERSELAGILSEYS